jgi:very-short-patch-repair endonuclease
MSLPEVQLWLHLRGAKAGAKFRRQHVVGNYIVDFYCAAAALVIEIDGAAHGMGDRAERDQVRDAALRARGLDVHRIAGGDVLKDAGAVAEAIALMVADRLASRGIESPLRPLRGHLPASGEDQ